MRGQMRKGKKMKKEFGVIAYALAAIGMVIYVMFFGYPF